MKLIFLPFFFFLALTLHAQVEKIGHLTYNRIQEAEMDKRAERLRGNAGAFDRGSSIELPFIDDFSTDRFPGNAGGEDELWLDLKAFRNNTYGLNPPTIGVATFDGADEFGYPYDFGAGNAAVPCDTLTSVPVNLDYDASENIWFSFYYQAFGFGERPELADSLVLQFYSASLDQWFWAWSSPGLANNVGQSAEEFTKVFIPVVQERYLNDGFQFRFVNYATPKGALDHWHIDYVHLDRNRQENEVLDDVAFVYPIRTLLSD
jgi:hypothetical protein